MWKVNIGRSVKEVRFVLKSGADHHGVWAFVNQKIPELRMLNPNTFFSLLHIDDKLKIDSACHFIFGDVANTEDMVSTAGLTTSTFEDIFKGKVANGMQLQHRKNKTNSERAIPFDIVEARTRTYMDDSF